MSHALFASIRARAFHLRAAQNADQCHIKPVVSRSETPSAIKLRPRNGLRRSSVVAREHASEPLAAHDAAGLLRWAGRWPGTQDQFIPRALAQPLLVVVVNALAYALREGGCDDGLGVRVPGDGCCGGHGAAAAGRVQPSVDGRVDVR